MDAEGFVRLVRKYTEIHELTPEILRDFIDKIVVYHREECFGETVQRVDIYYKMIGHIELPQIKKSQQEAYQEAFGREKAS